MIDRIREPEVLIIKFHCDLELPFQFGTTAINPTLDFGIQRTMSINGIEFPTEATKGGNVETLQQLQEVNQQNCNEWV